MHFTVRPPILDVSPHVPARLHLRNPLGPLQTQAHSPISVPLGIQLALPNTMPQATQPRPHCIPPTPRAHRPSTHYAGGPKDPDQATWAPPDPPPPPYAQGSQTQNPLPHTSLEKKNRLGDDAGTHSMVSTDLALTRPGMLVSCQLLFFQLCNMCLGTMQHRLLPTDRA